MMFIFFALVLSLVVAVFAVQNSIAVTVSFLLWSFQTSLVIIILGAATFGAIVVWLLSMWAQFRINRTMAKTLQRQTDLENNNKALQLKLDKALAENTQKTAECNEIKISDNQA